jgi:hypothetical protein
MNSRKSPMYMLCQTCVLHLVGSLGHVVHYGASRVRNVDALFFCSCGTSTDSTKSALGHVTPNLCFAFGTTRGSCCGLRCVPGVNHRRTIFLARVGPVMNPRKSALEHITPNSFFASCRICGSCSALWCV